MFYATHVEESDVMAGLLAGLDPIQRHWRRAMALTAYVDDSGSDPSDKTYILGGVVLPAEWWMGFSEHWRYFMDKAPRLEYFKGSEVGDHDKGAFRDFTGPERMFKVEGLVSILTDLHPLALSVSVRWDVFHQFRLAHNLAGVFANPYLFLYYNTIRMGAELGRKQSHPTPIDFVFDEHNKIGSDVQGWYAYFKDHAPAEWLPLLGKKPEFADEKTCLPLQAADLFAWYGRRKIVDKLNPWQETMWDSLSKYHTRIEMDADSLAAMGDSFGAIPMIEPTEYESFTAGLKKIIQANPAVVKAAMEEEKKERAEKRKEKKEQSK